MWLNTGITWVDEEGVVRAEFYFYQLIEEMKQKLMLNDGETIDWQIDYKHQGGTFQLCAKYLYMMQPEDSVLSEKLFDFISKFKPKNEIIVAVIPPCDIYDQIRYTIQKNYPITVSQNRIITIGVTPDIKNVVIEINNYIDSIFTSVFERTFMQRYAFLLTNK